MAETRQISTARQSEETEFEVTKVEYTDPKTGKHYTLETKIGRLEAPEGYFIGKEPFDTQGDAYDYARTYGEGRGRVMRQLIGNDTYYCYMHFFKFEEAGKYHSFINVEKWSQKQIAKQRENDTMLGLCSLDELRESGRDFASEDNPTESVGISKVMREQLDKKLAARKKNLDKYNRLREEGLNAREIGEKCNVNEWTIRDDLKRIDEVKKCNSLPVHQLLQLRDHLCQP